MLHRPFFSFFLDNIFHIINLFWFTFFANFPFPRSWYHLRSVPAHLSESVFCRVVGALANCRWTGWPVRHQTLHLTSSPNHNTIYSRLSAIPSRSWCRKATPDYFHFSVFTLFILIRFISIPVASIPLIFDLLYPFSSSCPFVFLTLRFLALLSLVASFPCCAR